MDYTGKMISPIGDIFITVDEDQVKSLTLDPSPLTEDQDRIPGLYKVVTKQLSEYFNGSRKSFDLPINFGPMTDFQRKVLDVMQEIPFGETVTYSELAEMAGNKKAVRAAASVCPKNPVFIVVPCHRVIRKDGSIGNYAFGSAVKKKLLEHELKFKNQEN